MIITNLSIEKIVKKKLKSLPELKFHNSDERTRKFVLKEISKQNISIVVCIIDKEGRRVADTPINYGIVVGTTIAEFLTVYPNLSLTVDKRYTNSKQQEEFQQAAQETINKFSKKGTTIFFNSPVDSRKESIVQLADFVAGAFNVKYNQDKDHYAKIVKDKVKIEKVFKWTKLKKRIANP